MTKTSDRSRLRGILLLVAAGAMTVTAACGGGGGGDDGGAAAGSTATTSGGSDAAKTQLDVDPCDLLTIPEMEAAVGSGIERGGFGEDPPGRCNYSRGGDVGAGVVGITNGDPLTCSALQRGLDAGSFDDTNAVKVDVGDGGFVERDGGTIQFLIGGGCISISASNSGVGIDQDALLILANAAAGRVG